MLEVQYLDVYRQSKSVIQKFESLNSWVLMFGDQKSWIQIFVEFKRLAG